MFFNEMIKLIQEKYKVLVYGHIDHSSIMDIVLLNDRPVLWSIYTLYIGHISQLQHLPDCPIMLLTTDRDLIVDSLPLESCLGIIDSKDIRGIVQMSKEILYDDLKSQVILYKIAEEALQGKNIVTLLNTAASIIGNALILVDSSMKILAYSTNFEIMDPLWAENIKSDYYSYEFMQKVKANQEMKEWSKCGEDSRIITLEGDIQPKLVTRITQNGHIVGALIMINHHKPIDHSHIKQLPQIGKILFDTFNSVFGDTMYRSFHSTILFYLISGEEPSDTFDLLTMSKVDFPKMMTVVVARFISPIENRYLQRTIGVNLERIFPEGYLVQFKSYISILVPSISADQREELSKLVNEEDINIGISWTFTDILDFKKYFTQAVASIKQAQSFREVNKVLNYTDYSFYDFLYNYNGETSLQNFCHPSLQILKEYDQSNKTELYLTLKTFLDSNKNLGETAQTLFLHRNSVIYRLKRIIELTSLDLNHMNTIYSLIDSFRIESFLSAEDILN